MNGVDMVVGGAGIHAAHLRRPVVAGEAERGGARACVLWEALCGAPVGEHAERPLLGCLAPRSEPDQAVVGLDVAVDDSARVDVGERQGQLMAAALRPSKARGRRCHVVRRSHLAELSQVAVVHVEDQNMVKGGGCGEEEVLEEPGSVWAVPLPEPGIEGGMLAGRGEMLRARVRFLADAPAASQSRSRAREPWQGPCSVGSL